MTFRSRWAAIALFAILAAGSLAPIWSNDYFWHLATGRWIVEHRGLPLHDPFGVASDPVRWINGEWLFQVAIWPVYLIGGHAALSIVLAIAVAALFASTWRWLSQRSDPAAALFMTIAAWYAADSAWFGVRPSAIAAILLVILLRLLSRASSPLRTVSLFLVTVVWINVHPSALIAPVIVGLWETGDAIRSGTLHLVSRAAAVAAAAVGLLLNPYGLEGILAPVRLVRLIGTLVVNQEWLPTTLERGGFFYATAAVALLLFAVSHHRRTAIPHALIFALLTFMAIRYVRNHLFYYSAYPILAGAVLPAELPERLRRLLLGATVILLGVTLANRPYRGGVDETRFPVSAVARLKASGLQGTIYNSNRFGGYLIWSFYPQRRAITDGRNELYTTFLRKWEKAQVDSRAWRALLDEYRVTLAVVDYREPPIEVVDAVTKEKRKLPRLEVFFPRKEWALVAADRAAVVLARRSAFSQQALQTGLMLGNR